VEIKTKNGYLSEAAQKLKRAPGKFQNMIRTVISRNKVSIMTSPSPSEHNRPDGSVRDKKNCKLSTAF
jgi:hypothetical protein